MTEEIRVAPPMMRKLTTANLVTLSRLIMLPLIVLFLVEQRRTAAFIIMLFSLVTDIFDGYIARKLKQETELGKVLDPLCDKISLAVILITLLLINSIPWWVVLIIVARDIMILLGSLIILRRRKIIFKANLYGKIAGFLFGALILAFTISLNKVGMALLYVAIPMMLITFGTYIYRYIKMVK